jgi:hypothetical protein
LWN